MKFVDGKKDGNGNIYDVRTNNQTRHKGSDIGVELAGKSIADKVQNIYDLEGNCYEYVAEKNNTSSPFVLRGADCGYAIVVIIILVSNIPELATVIVLGELLMVVLHLDLYCI
jgi:hypothetical protein